MSKQDEAGLILKLYELRREHVMREARDWFFRDFHPESFADFQNAMFSEHSGHLRMVLTYWDMAAGLVNNGAIDLKFFNDTNGEQFGVFAKIEPIIGQIRAAMAPEFLKNFEKLIDDTPEGRERCATARERFKGIRAMMAERQSKAAART